MTAAELENILDQAKALSEHDRARLAHDLVATLDGQPDSDVATAWDREVERRLAEIKNGIAKTISREELTQRLRNRTG
ncbi:MAG: addiction module protein [Aquisalimonadaceae bacterium]